MTKIHAEKLIESTMQIALRPQKDDRVDVCIAVLEYLLNNFSYSLPCDHMDEFHARMYGAGSAVNTDDINDLIYQLQKLK